MTTGENERPAPAHDDDRLQRALAALKRTPVPDGPSPAALANTLAAVEAAANSRKISLFQGRRTMFAGLKIAAALLAAVGGVYLFSSPFLVGSTVTFAEVAMKLQKAHTLAYTMASEIPGQPKMPPVRLLFKEPGHLRCESVPAGASVVISDNQNGKCLMLNPTAKSGVMLVGRLPGTEKPGSQDIAASEVASFRKLADKHGEPVGEKQIGQVRARGFRVVMAPGYETVVWADPQTRVPVQLEVSAPYGDQTIRSTVSDIQLDLELDDSLFSLEPPQGYTVTKQNLTPLGEKDDGSPEAAIAALLRLYAENSGGNFPKRLDDWGALGEALKGKKLDEFPQAAAFRIAMVVSRVQVFILDRKGDFTYKPDGVKLGEAGKMLLWYKQKGKQTYRVLYGDLRSADVPADQVLGSSKPQSKP
jgi:outer membrane lipoprotein-sorting protein